MNKIIIDLAALHKGQAKIAKMDDYLRESKDAAGFGNHVILTGMAPIWMYLKIAHVLHGKAMRLSYDSPSTGMITVFNHNPH